MKNIIKTKGNFIFSHDDESNFTTTLVSVMNREYLIFLENGHQIVIYNNEHLHNYLPNRLVFTSQKNMQEDENLAIKFLEKFGSQLDTMD